MSETSFLMPVSNVIAHGVLGIAILIVLYSPRISTTVKFPQVAHIIGWVLALGNLAVPSFYFYSQYFK